VQQRWWQAAAEEGRMAGSLSRAPPCLTYTQRETQTHTQTHTHMYIYLYIHTCASLSLSLCVYTDTV